MAKLSLAGRVLIVNQVLLATLWYVASCWIFLNQQGQIRRLVGNVLRVGDVRDKVRANITRNNIIAPLDKRALGIIDVLDQCKT